MFSGDQRKLERTRCVSIPTKDGCSKISALSIDFEHCRLHSSSERLPFSSRSPFPLKQNSWVLDDSETSHSSSHSNIRSDSFSQKTPSTSYLLPQISPGKSSHSQSPSKQPSTAKKPNFRSSSSDSVHPKLSQKSKPSSSIAAGHRFPSSLLSRDSQGLCRPLNDDEFSSSYYVDESRPRGDGCEDDESWMEGGMYESDDGDVLSDLEGEMDESEEAEVDDYVSDDSRSTGVDEEGRIFRGHSLTFSKKTSHIAGSFQPLGNSTLPRDGHLKPLSKGGVKTISRSVKISLDSHLSSTPARKEKELRSSKSLSMSDVGKKRLKPLGSHTHTIKSHTHTVGSHTYTVGSHTHTVGNHTHNIDTGRVDECSPLTQSLFPGCQPTIHFPFGEEEYEPLPPEQKALLKWKMTPITPNILKTCINRVGFTRLKKGTHWMGYWGKHMKSEGFKSVKDYQKINHFPGSFAIGRKDRLWRSLARMQALYGKKNFDFVPQTFVLPSDMRLLKREWEEGGVKNKWIIKPPASARGIGIRVVHKWSQLPKKRPVVVQRYISNPYLIRGCKFDLRVYVYVTSYDPLRIYMFRDGLARFATCKYTATTKSLSNRFVHLTNYSINKKNVTFEQNPDETVCQGHKWGLLALWEYMRNEFGVDTDKVWESIKDLAIKTIISSEAAVVSYLKANVRNKWSCHELFGFDVMLDSHLKPWIIEVNISPSLHSNSQLDINIKGRMMRDILNMCQFTVPTGDTFSELTQSASLTSHDRAKHALFVQKSTVANSSLYSYDVLDNLTEDDVRVLMETEDELKCCGHFERVFPSPTSYTYLKYFEIQRYYNVLLNAWVGRFSGKQRLKGIALLRSRAIT